LPRAVQNAFLHARLLCLLFGVQSLNNLLLAISVTFAIEPELD